MDKEKFELHGSVRASGAKKDFDHPVLRCESVLYSSNFKFGNSRVSLKTFFEETRYPRLGEQGFDLLAVVTYNNAIWVVFRQYEGDISDDWVTVRVARRLTDLEAMKLADLAEKNG